MTKSSAFSKKLNLGGCDVFYAVRSYADPAGAHRCDIFSPDGAVYHSGCFVVNGQSNRIGAPPEHWKGVLDFEKHPQVLVLYRSSGRGPVVLSKVDSASLSYLNQPNGPPSSGTVESNETSAQSDTSSTEVTVNDVVFLNDNSRILLKDTESGGDVILAPERHMKIQLGTEGVLRVSSSGTSDDGPVLTNGFALRDAEILACLRSIVTFLQTAQIVPNPATAGATMMFAPTAGSLTVPDALNPGDVRSAFVKLPSQTETRRGVEGD